jgi:hypothetical protein
MTCTNKAGISFKEDVRINKLISPSETLGCHVTALTMMISVFWDVMLCCLVDHCGFEVTYCLNLQGIGVG